MWIGYRWAFRMLVSRDDLYTATDLDISRFAIRNYTCCAFDFFDGFAFLIVGHGVFLSGSLKTSRIIWHNVIKFKFCLEVLAQSD